MQKPSVHILIPSLFSPLPLWQKDFAFNADSLLVASLFSHTDSNDLPVTGLENTLFHLIGHPTEQELPIAHYRYQLDFDTPPEKKNILCADPVHIQTGIDQMLLHPIAWDVICPKETADIIQKLNLHFAQDDFFFEVSEKHNGHWYLIYDKVKQSIPLSTTPLSDMLGQDVFKHLPKSDTLNWHQLLNETQMLLHPSPLEETQKNAGDLPINSVWLWGGGEAYDEPLKHNIDTIFGNTAISATTAFAADCQHQPLPDTIEPLLEGTNLLLLDKLILPAVQDQPILWHKSLNHLSEHYLRPLYQKWRENVLDINLYTCDGRHFEVRKRHFWEVFQKVPSNLLNFAKPQ